MYKNQESSILLISAGARAAFLLLLLAGGCGGPPANSGVVTLPTTSMQIAGHRFTLEKATTVGEQEFGLMRRDSMAADHGMIFIFPRQQPETFWNHDVRFPLDVIFLDSGGRVVSIQQMQAYNDADTQTVNAQYVIELNEGMAKKIGLKVGDRLTLPPDVTGR